jgi:hypothetical protein
MPMDDKPRDVELMLELVAEANKQPPAVGVFGIWGIPIQLTPREPLIIGARIGGKISVAANIVLVNGLPMGRYRYGMFLFPESDQPLIIGNTKIGKE